MGGRIMGICMTVSGVASFANAPLINAAVSANNFTPLLLGGLVACIPMFFIFALLHWRQQRGEEMREPLSTRPRAFSTDSHHLPILSPMGGALMAEAFHPG